MLTTDAHGGFGGIAQYNRDVVEVFASLDVFADIVVLPRIVNEPHFTTPPKVRYDLGGCGGKAAYLLRSVTQAVSGGTFSLVYCAHINLMPIAAAIARLKRIPLVLAIYGIDAWRPPGRILVAPLARACQHVFSVSQITLDRFRLWAGTGQATTAVLPNAIHVEQFGLGPLSTDLVVRHGLGGRKVIMTLGRMSPTERYKGFDEVIELLPRLRTVVPEITYLIAGDGADRPRLAAKASELSVDDLVVFAGRIPEERKADYYRLADAYVMPSRGEGFGFVVLEALACGVPVVASMNDGTREAVRGGMLGILIDPASPDELERGIMAALHRPKQIPAGLAYFAFERFAERLRGAISRVMDHSSHAAEVGS